MFILEKPALRHKAALLEAVREFHGAGEYDISAEELGAKFEALIEQLDHSLDPTVLLPDELPYEDFWMMEGDQWIGKLTLRVTLDKRHYHAGGHIGYEIRPSRRRCGCGTALLRLGLEKARERGLLRVLLTCDETNFASQKVIERNGGKLENIVDVDGQTVRKMRYWIEL
jgi:predicted acetyltransferase